MDKYRWEARNANTTYDDWRVEDLEGEVVSVRGKNGAEYARLIAAAPDLLEACEEVRVALLEKTVEIGSISLRRSLESQIVRLTKAIEKAQGEEP
jgi:hypothetical protein